MERPPTDAETGKQLTTQWLALKQGIGNNDETYPELMKMRGRVWH